MFSLVNCWEILVSNEKESSEQISVQELIASASQEAESETVETPESALASGVVERVEAEDLSVSDKQLVDAIVAENRDVLAALALGADGTSDEFALSSAEGGALSERVAENLPFATAEDAALSVAQGGSIKDAALGFAQKSGLAEQVSGKIPGGKAKDIAVALATDGAAKDALLSVARGGSIKDAALGFASSTGLAAQVSEKLPGGKAKELVVSAATGGVKDAVVSLAQGGSVIDAAKTLVGDGQLGEKLGAFIPDGKAKDALGFIATSGAKDALVTLASGGGVAGAAMALAKNAKLAEKASEKLPEGRAKDALAAFASSGKVADAVGAIMPDGKAKDALTAISSGSASDAIVSVLPDGKAKEVARELRAKVKRQKGDRDASKYVSSPAPLFFLETLLTLFLGAVNAVACKVAGSDALVFLLIFDLLGLVLMAAPAALLARLRKSELTIFEVALAFAAIFSVLGVMTVFAYQAKTYGASIKTSLLVPIESTNDEVAFETIEAFVLNERDGKI